MKRETFYDKTLSVRKKSWTLVRERAALLVIDMQNDFVKEGGLLEVPRIRSQLPLIKRLIETCRELEVPVIYTRQVYPPHSSVNPLSLQMFPLLEREGLRKGTDGAEICMELAPEPGDLIVEKMGFNAFHDTQLESFLRNIGGRRKVDTVIICGTATNICCESTARGAVERDYKVVFGSDVNSAWTDEFQSATLKNIQYAFGRVMSCNEIMNALRNGETE